MNVAKKCMGKEEDGEQCYINFITFTKELICLFQLSEQRSIKSKNDEPNIWIVMYCERWNELTKINCDVKFHQKEDTEIMWKWIPNECWIRYHFQRETQFHINALKNAI